MMTFGRDRSASIYFVICALITLLPAGIATYTLYIVVAGVVPPTWSDAAVGAGCALLMLMWIIVASAAACGVARWRTPLAIIDDDGITMPHSRPERLGWDEVEEVTQTRIGNWECVMLKV